MTKEFEDRKKENLLVLENILVQGQHVPVGSVIPKSTMSKTDWQNLAFSFDPPRVVETDDNERYGPLVSETVSDAQIDAMTATAGKLPGVK